MDPTAQLWLAIRVGRGELFLKTAAANPQLLQSKDDQGNSALHWFAIRGEAKHIQHALSLGATVDVLGLNAQTPLMWAIISGHLDAAQALIRAGANVNSRDSLGATPAILAVQHARHLLLLALIDAGADLSAADIKGCNVAHWAAYKNGATVLRMLHRRGMDVSSRDAEGLTPLHRAARGGAIEAARYLIEQAGVDPCELVRDVTSTTAPEPAHNNNGTSESSSADDPVSSQAPPPALASPSRAIGSVGVRSRAVIGTAYSASSEAAAAAAAAAGNSGNDDDEDDARPASGQPSLSLLAKRAASLISSANKKGLPSSSAAGDLESGRTSAAVSGDKSDSSSSTAVKPRLPAQNQQQQKQCQNAVTVAQDSQRIMISSARAAGTYSGPENQALIERQAALIGYLRSAAEAASGRIDGLPTSPLVTEGMSGKRRVLHHFSRALNPLLRLRARNRVVTPALCFFAALWCAWLFEGHLLRLLTEGERSASYLLVLCWVACVWALRRTDPGCVDRYGALGPDWWTTAPLRRFLSRVAPVPQRFPTTSSSQSSSSLAGAGASPESVMEEGASLARSDVSPTSRLLADVATETASCVSALGDMAHFPLIAGSPEQQSINALNPSVAVQARICFSCELIRPLRAEHVPVADRCYQRFDHFSQRLGVPIAARNLRLYAAFLLLDIGCTYLFLAALWRYLEGGYTRDGNPLVSEELVRATHYYDLGAAANADVTLMQRLGVLLKSSTWSLFFFACCVGASFVVSTRSAWKLAQNAAANLTQFERENYLELPFGKSAPPSAQPASLPSLLPYLSVSAVDGDASSSSGAAPALAGLQLAPKRINPFDSGSALRNVLAFFSPPAPDVGASADVGVTSLASVMSRHATETEALADALAAAMTLSASSAASAAPAIQASPAPPAAFSSPSSATTDAEEAPMASSTASSGAAGNSAILAAQEQQQQQQQQQQPQPSMAQPFGAPPLAMVARQRALVLRSSLTASQEAWMQFEGRWALQHGAAASFSFLSRFGHGHSHSGRGGGHGHSHGGQPCDGHGHGGSASGGAAAVASSSTSGGTGNDVAVVSVVHSRHGRGGAAAIRLNPEPSSSLSSSVGHGGHSAGSGGHGHSHGGVECHGHQ